MSVIVTRAVVLEETTHGPILEIAFEGEHRDGVGPDMAARAKAAVDANNPAAIVLNMLQFEYRFGNDIGGIFLVFYDRAAHRSRPGCILAEGATKRSLAGLLGPSKIDQTFELEYFSEPVSAMAYLRRKLQEGTA